MPYEPIPDDAPPDLLPPAFMSDEQRRKEPLGSPYAVPLTALVASAYVAVTEHVQVQPAEDHLALPGAIGPLYADDGS